MLSSAVFPEMAHPDPLQLIPVLLLSCAIFSEITLPLPATMPFPFEPACTFLTMLFLPARIAAEPPNPVIVPFCTVTSTTLAAEIPFPLVEPPGPTIENPFKSMVTSLAFTSIASALVLETVRFPVRR